MTRDEALQSGIPDLIADVVIYSAAEGGRNRPAYLGWGCLALVSKELPLIGYSSFPLLGDIPLLPGDVRRLGFVFLNKEGVAKMRKAGKFNLWEGRFVGEATVVD